MTISTSTLAFLLFVCFILVVALAISHMLLRELREKQKAYSSFAGHVDQFMLFMSEDYCLLDVFPRFLQDPFYEEICQKKKFSEVLSTEEYLRFLEYLKGAAAYPNIPFVFSFRGEVGVLWYELRAGQKKIAGKTLWELLLKNVTLDVDSRTQRDQLQDKVNMLMQNAGDFLWSFDVDSRQLTLLTPITDDEGRVIPRSAGPLDIHSLLRDEEYAMFEKRINARIVAFRASNQDVYENATLRMRLIGPDDQLVWYSFRCKICLEENSKLVIKGSARRMDLLTDNPIFDGDEDVNAALASLLSFPDIRLFCVDRENKIVNCNQAFALDFKFTSPKVVNGKRLLEVVRTKYYSFIQGNLSEVFEGGKPKSWKGPFNKEHRLLWFNAIPLIGKDGFVHRVMGVYIQMDEDEFRESI